MQDKSNETIANSALVLRPMLPTDLSHLSDIFERSVMQLTADDYDEEQRLAWAETALEPQFAEKLSSELTLVITHRDLPVGFASLKNNEMIDMLYCDPDFSGQGVGKHLCHALETLAKGRHATQLQVLASDTALGFFQACGYQPSQRQSVLRNGEWLVQTLMQKNL